MQIARLLKNQRLAISWTLAATVAILTASHTSAQMERAADSENLRISVEQQGPLFVRRGSVHLTDSDIDAFLATVPGNRLQGFLASRDRVGQMIDGLLQQRALAEMALDEGFLEDAEIQSSVLQAATERLSSLYLNHYLADNELDNYEQKAQELFLTNRENYRKADRFSYTHIMIPPSPSVPEYRAVTLLAELYEAYQEQNESLVDFSDGYLRMDEMPLEVTSHDEVPVSQLSPEIASVLLEIDAGFTTPPFRTPSGWHVVQLLDISPGEIPDYAEIQSEALEDARRIHRERLSEQLLSDLAHQELSFPVESLDRLLEKYNVEW